jgi:hypothetical protein
MVTKGAAHFALFQQEVKEGSSAKVNKMNYIKEKNEECLNFKNRATLIRP